MSQRLKESEPLETALRRLSVECIELALAALDEVDGYDEMVHSVRKLSKQQRALLRLFRPALGAGFRSEMHEFRDLARSLSAARDGAVALDVHQALTGEFRAALDASVGARIRQALIADQRRTMARGRRSAGPPDRDGLRARLLAARARCRRWTLVHAADGVLESGLKRSYRRARCAVRHARQTNSTAAMHELRKHAKDYFYQLEFVARRWPDFSLGRTARVRRLTQLLGEGQDMVVYHEAIGRAAAGGYPEAVGILQALAEHRRCELRAQALDLAQLIFAARPKQFLAELSYSNSLVRATG